MNRFIRYFSTKRVGNNFIRKKVKKPISKKKVEIPFLWKDNENNKKENKVNKKAPFLWKSTTNNYYDCPKIDKKYKYDIPKFFDE